MDADFSSVDGTVVLKETCSPSLSHKICLARSSKRGGRGLFAKERIAKGEVVWRMTDTHSSKADPIDEVMAMPDDARKAFLHFAYCTFLQSIVYAGGWGSCRCGRAAARCAGVSDCG